MGLFPGLPLHRCSVSDFLGLRRLWSSLDASTPGCSSSRKRCPRPRLLTRSEDRATCSLRQHPARGNCSFRPRGFSPPRRFSPRLGCGLVASRYRSWGSSRLARASFLVSRRTSPPDHQSPGRLPHDERPFGAFPSSAAGPCHHGLFPSCCHRAVLAVLPPEGASHAHRRVFRFSRSGPHARSARGSPGGPTQLCTHVSQRSGIG